jgi:hypothetical protein
VGADEVEQRDHPAGDQGKTNGRDVSAHDDSNGVFLGMENNTRQSQPGSQLS